jgi:uncharacterized protein YaeQ
MRVDVNRPGDAGLTATIYNFDIELADTDRHVYESLALRVARHPSESEEYLVARVIAYLLEFAELAGKKIHNAEALELYAVDRALVSALVARLDRRVAFSVSVSSRELYLTIGADNLTGAVVRLSRDA